MTTEHVPRFRHLPALQLGHGRERSNLDKFKNSCIKVNDLFHTSMKCNRVEVVGVAGTGTGTVAGAGARGGKIRDDVDAAANYRDFPRVPPFFTQPWLLCVGISPPLRP